MGDSADARAYRPRVRSRRSPICGIAGYYARGRGPVVAATIRRQCDAILHRGPDSDGVLVDGDFGFGMRRLSIVDLAGSDQPIHSADRRHAIVFNGEIYNYRRLRDELAALGHRFATDGDTEVVLAAWRQWGRDAWARLDGMFAVAIWDRSSRRLTLARDAIGIKPLYYAINGHTLAFGSELKAILALPGMTFDIDSDAVHGYFTFGHMRGPSTIYLRSGCSNRERRWNLARKDQRNIIDTGPHAIRTTNRGPMPDGSTPFAIRGWRQYGTRC